MELAGWFGKRGSVYSARPSVIGQAGKNIGADMTPAREAWMPKAIRVEQYGGPEVLKWTDVDVGKPGTNQLRLRQTAIGVNFIDIYYRTGMYKAPEGLPFTPGSE